MKEDLKYPDIDAACSVLKKIGVNPTGRVSRFDQDFEYTSCDLSELDQYLTLYKEDSTSDLEKRVLGCYFLQCLNDHVANESEPHASQSEIFKIMFNDINIHQSELEYWGDSSDCDQNNWWPITSYILSWQK